MQEDVDRLREEGMLWSDFQKSAQAVGRLYQECSWKNLQKAALFTTQLYKNGMEYQKRAFERGYVAGKISLSKEICSLRFNCNANLDDIMKILAKSCRQSSDNEASTNIAAVNEDTDDGVVLFQEALHIPSAPCEGSESSDLNTFISKQLHRSRKRVHSPSIHFSRKKNKH